MYGRSAAGVRAASGSVGAPGGGRWPDRQAPYRDRGGVVTEPAVRVGQQVRAQPTQNLLWTAVAPSAGTLGEG